MVLSSLRGVFPLAMTVVLGCGEVPSEDAASSEAHFSAAFEDALTTLKKEGYVPVQVYDYAIATSGYGGTWCVNVGEPSPACYDVLSDRPTSKKFRWVRLQHPDNRVAYATAGGVVGPVRLGTYTIEGSLREEVEVRDFSYQDDAAGYGTVLQDILFGANRVRERFIGGAARDAVDTEWMSVPQFVESGTWRSESLKTTRWSFPVANEGGRTIHHELTAGNTRVGGRVWFDDKGLLRLQATIPEKTLTAKWSRPDYTPPDAPSWERQTFVIPIGNDNKPVRTNPATITPLRVEKTAGGPYALRVKIDGKAFVYDSLKKCELPHYGPISDLDPRGYYVARTLELHEERLLELRKEPYLKNGTVVAADYRSHEVEALATRRSVEAVHTRQLGSWSLASLAFKRQLPDGTWACFELER